MIVDTSALMVVLLSEPEQERFFRVMRAADRLRLSAGTAIELSVVGTRGRGGRLDSAIAHLLDLLRPSVEPVTTEQARLGAQAYRSFGKGSGHPAQLNFGDCFAYALSKALAEPLLFNGDDFIHTDVLQALPR